MVRPDHMNRRVCLNVCIAVFGDDDLSSNRLATVDFFRYAYSFVRSAASVNAR